MVLPDLFVYTPNALLCLNLKDYQFDPAAASESGENPPTPEVCLKFPDAGPFSPVKNFMKLGSSVYFIGGRSREIYKYYLTENTIVKSHDLIFNTIKDEPAAVEIDGKVYVFNAYPPLNLEVFDPSCRRWKLIHDPGLPFFDYFVHRHKLYTLPEEHPCYLDTRSNKWHEEDAMFKYKSFLHPEMKIPGGGRSACGDEDIILALKAVDKYTDYRFATNSRCFLYAYLYSKNSILLACQNLGNVFGEHELYMQSHHLLTMEDGKFCALAIGSLPQYKCFSTRAGDASFYFPEMVLGVSVFSVTKLPTADQLQDIPTVLAAVYVDPAHPTPSEEEFLSLTIEKTCFFALRDMISVIEGAFLRP